MTKNDLARQWLDRIYWRLLEDGPTTPRGAHLNSISWPERQLIAKIRRGFQRRSPSTEVTNENGPVED